MTQCVPGAAGPTTKTPAGELPAAGELPTDGELPTAGELPTDGESAKAVWTGGAVEELAADAVSMATGDEGALGEAKFLSACAEELVHP